MNYQSFFEKTHYYHETEVSYPKVRDDLVIGILSGLVFGIAHFLAIKAGKKIFESE